MKTFNQVMEEDRKLTILRLLAESPDYKANMYLLQSALEGFGHVVSIDRIKADIAWLAEGGLVLAESAGAVLVPKLTHRGIDVAKGRVEHPGVKRPEPDL